VKKLLLFAQAPPPLHGQSFMVEQVLIGFGGDARSQNKSPSPHTPFACFHVNCRVSRDLEEIGRMRLQKAGLLLKYCFQAIRCRVRFGGMYFFYIPAPAMRSAIFRDWLVMALCRPFFRHLILYWQAAGLGEWLEKEALPWERWLTRILLGRPDLSIVMGAFCRIDAVALRSRKTIVVPNGIPDPCPEYYQKILPERRARATARAQLNSAGSSRLGESSAGGTEPRLFRVLFLSLCTREKGLFDALEAVVAKNRELARRSACLRVQLTVAGKFWREDELLEFQRRLHEPDIAAGANAEAAALTARAGIPEPLVRYCGFVGGEEKRRLFRESDCFCFPTYYRAESFGLVLVEAMAYGLDIITTNWRTIPELLPPGYAGIVEPRSPQQIAAAMDYFTHEYHGETLRARFENTFTVTEWLERMTAALNEVDMDGENSE
jgi:glycosyltransferase involved in cell wall biosynthesis